MRIASLQEFYIPLDTGNEDELGLSRDVESVVALCGPLGLNNVTLSLHVLGGVLSGALLDDLALLLVGLRNS